MPQCIVTGVEITPENDSKAHVIPSALGGVLKPLGVLSKVGNGQLGDLVDLPLIESFQPLMTLLDGARDRGVNQPLIMRDEGGCELKFTFGEPLQLSNPEFDETPTTEGHHFRISARTMKEARTLLGRVRRHYPNFDIDAAMGHAARVYEWPEGKLSAQLQIGPRTTFPALFTSAAIVAAHNGLPIHPQFKAYLDHFEPGDPEMPPDTFYFMPEKRWFTVPAQVANTVALCASPSRHQCIIHLELLSTIAVAVVLPYDGREEVRFTHSVDVLEGRTVLPTPHWDRLAALPWSATHTHDLESFRELVADNVKRLVGISQRRQLSRLSEDLVRRAFGEIDYKMLLPEQMIRLVDVVQDHVKLEWRRPGCTYGERTRSVEGFRALCAQIAPKLPTRLQGYFTAHADTVQRQLLIEARQADPTRQN